ncbi:hypothetical protein [Caudoviricetes sp.]|nr:hypothetical protein [Caudoviricetes sp.]
MNDQDKQYTLGMLPVWAKELTEFIDAYDIKRNDIPSLKLLRVRNELEEMARRNNDAIPTDEE